MAKKNAKKSKSKSEGRLAKEVQGLLLIALAALVLVALCARIAQGPENLLGPYFGVLLAQALVGAGGPLAAFLVPFILFAAGLRRFRGIRGGPSLRKIVFFVLLFLEVSGLLSVNIVRRVPAPGMFLGGGGTIGVFIARFIYLPLFGTGAFGPYFVTISAMAITILWGAQLRLEHFSLALQALKDLFSDFREELSERWEPEESGRGGPAARRRREPKPLLNDDLIRAQERTRQGDERRRLEEKQQEFIREKSGMTPQIMAAEPSETEKPEPAPKPQAETAAEKRKRLQAQQEAETPQTPVLEQVPETGEPETPEEPTGSSEPTTKSIPIIAGVEAKKEIKQIDYEPYRFPPLDILKEPPSVSENISKEELIENSRILEEKLNDFGVQGKVVQVNPGPIITRYEIELAPGIKVNRVHNLSDDLAMAMKATRVRILAPIPGKSAVGIELPNSKPSTIYLREILASDKFPGSKGSITLAIGKTIIHEPYVTDLTRMPHLLVAGQTGSGKSVCINCIISSILYSKAPEDCRLLMIDPKVVELALYNDIPHLLSPVVTDVREAVKCLKWAVAEMERRYRLLAKVAVRNISGFNEKFEKAQIKEGLLSTEENKKLPYIVFIIDELADLMMTAANEVESHIVRLAQLARAVGIHLIVATQRPSANVITGLIKANMPSRIAFQVASKIDSRVILDQNGADKLLGRGDMLFIPPGIAEPVRLHGALVTDGETEAIVEAVRHQKVRADRLETWGIADEGTPEGDSEPAGGPSDSDLFVEAARLVVRHQLGSTSLIQRRLKVGYARAGRLMDELEAVGIVGGNNGSKARDVLMDEGSLEQLLANRRGQ